MLVVCFKVKMIKEFFFFAFCFTYLCQIYILHFSENGEYILYKRILVAM